ncbi:MAG: protein kinase domain-containing protein [Planctomycetota bacterium]
MKPPSGYELGSAYKKDITGVFYRAVQLKLDRPVTLKILRSELVDNDRARRIFLAERDLVTSLEHPNLLLVIDTGEVDGLPYFITESTAEPTLAEALRGDDPLLETRAVAIALAIARALHHLADKACIYKNLAPQYVLLPRPSTAKLVTFRNVKPIGEAARFRGAKVQSGHYCAPELTRKDRGPVTPKTNVYALGALLYHMLAGAPPLPGKSDTAREAHAANAVPPLRETRPFMRDRAYSVVSQLMCYDQARRADPGTAVAMLDAYTKDPLVASPLKKRKRRRRRR